MPGIHPSDDRAGLAELWLAELGAWVPEWRHGSALEPRVRRFGLDRSVAERARLAGGRLAGEARRARAYRARPSQADPG